MYFLPPIDPEDQAPAYAYTVDLAGEEYEINLRWNERLEAWFFDLLDSDGDYLLRGDRIHPNKILGRKAEGRRPSGGALFCWDTKTTGEPVEYEDLGSRIKLAWLTDAEILEFA